MKSEKDLEKIQGKLLLESDARTFRELDLSIRYGLVNFAECFFPDKSYEEVLLVVKTNFENAFYYKF